MDAAQLKAARRAAGLSARELAKAAGVSHRSIQRAEATGASASMCRRYVEAAHSVLRERTTALSSVAPLDAFLGT
jgi:predicted transcriptional regulator